MRCGAVVVVVVVAWRVVSTVCVCCVQEVSAGSDHTCGNARSTAQMLCFGSSSDGKTTVPVNDNSSGSGADNSRRSGSGTATGDPTGASTGQPSVPSAAPSDMPSLSPRSQPSSDPTGASTGQPSRSGSVEVICTQQVVLNNFTFDSYVNGTSADILITTYNGTLITTHSSSGPYAGTNPTASTSNHRRSAYTSAAEITRACRDALTASGAWCLVEGGQRYAPAADWPQGILAKGHVAADRGLAQAFLNKFLRGRSILDMGSGQGQYGYEVQLDNAKTGANTEWAGYDGALNIEQYTGGTVSWADFTKPNFKPVDGMTRDWVLCLEVGQHIPDKYSDTLASSIAANSKCGAILSWGMCGQGGTGHTNCKDTHEVVSLMKKHNMVYDAATSMAFRSVAKYAWFRNTVMVYYHEGMADNPACRNQVVTPLDTRASEMAPGQEIVPVKQPASVVERKRRLSAVDMDMIIDDSELGRLSVNALSIGSSSGGTVRVGGVTDTNSAHIGTLTLMATQNNIQVVFGSIASEFHKGIVVQAGSGVVLSGSVSTKGSPTTIDTGTGIIELNGYTFTSTVVTVFGTETGAPSSAPSSAPSNAPSNPPTYTPNTEPTNAPSYAPSYSPSYAPSYSPSYAPSYAPSMTPTAAPIGASDWTPVSAPWPTLPESATLQIDQVNQHDVSVSVLPFEGFVGFRCFTAAPANQLTSFTTMSSVTGTETSHAPIFDDHSTSITGYVERSVLRGYSRGLPTAFLLSAGDACSLTSAHCVTSPSYPSSYGIGTCTITLMESGYVTATAFDVEEHYDYVRINDVDYDGSTGPVGIQVTQGSEILFYADNRGHAGGWKICFEAPPTPTPTPTPTSTPSLIAFTNTSVGVMPPLITMKVGTTDGSQSDGTCSKQLDRCTEYVFLCDVRNIAGWSPAVRLPELPSIVKTPPDLPDQSRQPVIQQMGEAGAGYLSDRFTVIIARPPDSVDFGGPCSDYTFQLNVTSVKTSKLVFSEVGLPEGEYLIDGLTPVTEYAVVVQARNQAGWGIASNPLMVQTAARIFKVRFVTQLDLPFSSGEPNWVHTEHTYEAEIKDIFCATTTDPSIVKVSTVAVQWLTSTSVDTEIVVHDLVIGAETVEALRSQAANNKTFTLGGSPVLSISLPTSLDSRGGSITSIMPNLGSTALGSTTTITVFGDLLSNFESATSIFAGGDEPTPRVLSTSAMEIEMTSQANTAQMYVVVAGVGSRVGSNAQVFYQYDHNSIAVTACTPTSGKQVGSPLVEITVLGLDTVLAIPGLHTAGIKCRFGNLEVKILSDVLHQHKLIRCVPPDQHFAGKVAVGVSLNGQQWLESDVFFEYLPVYYARFVAELFTPFKQWSTVRDDYESTTKTRLESSSVTTNALNWADHTLVVTTGVVEPHMIDKSDPSGEIISLMIGTSDPPNLTLGTITYPIEIGQPVVMDSNGPGLNSVVTQVISAPSTTMARIARPI